MVPVIKFELGLTISAGVSFNKIFAKLGSDMKKPDAVTVIPQDNYKNIVWNLPASDMLVPSTEMSIEDFDAWKARLTEEAHDYFNKDKRETRENVSIEKLLETNLVCYESVEDEYIREEDERQALPKTMDIASEIMQVLSCHIRILMTLLFKREASAMTEVSRAQ